MNRVFAYFCFICLASLFAVPVQASEAPQPPCGHEPIQNFPSSDAPPEIHLWLDDKAQDNAPSQPCNGWRGKNSSLVITLAGSFTSTRGADEILRQIGQIKALSNVKYWSVTDKKWNALFIDPAPLVNPDNDEHRADFTPEELRSGDSFYFAATDIHTHKKTVSRIFLDAKTENQFAFQTENVTPMKFLTRTFAAPGDLQSWYYFKQTDDHTWQFFSLTRVLYGSGFFAHFISSESYVNRVKAMYLYFAQGNTDAASGK